jgi:hypothetical protein
MVSFSRFKDAFTLGIDCSKERQLKVYVMNLEIGDLEFLRALLLGRDAVSLEQWLPTFRKIVMLSFSRFKEIFTFEKSRHFFHSDRREAPNQRHIRNDTNHFRNIPEI